MRLLCAAASSGDPVGRRMASITPVKSSSFGRIGGLARTYPAETENLSIFETVHGLMPNRAAAVARTPSRSSERQLRPGRANPRTVSKMPRFSVPPGYVRASRRSGRSSMIYRGY